MGTGEKSTIYIDGRPVWELGNSEVEPKETETRTGPLPSVAESAKAELMAQAFSPELIRKICVGIAKLMRKVAELNLIETLGSPKDLYFYKHCKKLRVRKKYLNRLLKKVRAKREALEDQEEADE